MRAAIRQNVCGLPAVIRGPNLLPRDWTGLMVLDSSGAGSSNPVQTSRGPADLRGYPGANFVFTRGATGFSRAKVAPATAAMGLSIGQAYAWWVWLRRRNTAAGLGVALRSDANNGAALALTSDWRRFQGPASTVPGGNFEMQLLIWSSIPNTPLTDDVDVAGWQLMGL